MDDSVPGVAEIVDHNPLGVWHAWHRQGFDGHDDHVFVDYAIVLNVGPHCQRRSLFAAVEENRGARDYQQQGQTAMELADEFAQRSSTVSIFRCSVSGLAVFAAFDALECRKDAVKVAG